MSRVDLPAEALAMRRLLIGGVWHERVDAAAVPVDRLRDVRGNVGGALHPVEAGRYHLYVSYACPFAHRVLLVRALLGLEEAIGISVLHPHIAGPNGWSFAPAAPDDHYPEATVDHLHGDDYLYETYRRSDPTHTGRISVPVLWDRVADRMVSNDSGQIMRDLATAFLTLAERPLDLCPPGLIGDIDRLGLWLARRVNNAVYGVGTAVDRPTYVTRVEALFDALDTLDRDLAGRRFLLGDFPTEPDLRLFATLARLDLGYATALRCDLRPLGDFAHLSAHAERVSELPGVAATVKPDHISRHYLDDDSFVGNRGRARPGSQASPSDAGPSIAGGPGGSGVGSGS